MKGKKLTCHLDHNARILSLAHSSKLSNHLPIYQEIKGVQKLLLGTGRTLEKKRLKVKDFSHTLIVYYLGTYFREKVKRRIFLE